VPFGTAYRACYRAQLLNATLPGGILGDVHRGVRHGRDSGAFGRGLSSVVWDRVSGQVVQAGLLMIALPFLPDSLRPWGVGMLVVVVAVGLVGREWLRERVRNLGGAAGVWPQVVLLSAVAALGHVVVFVVAARTAGVDLATYELVPLALAVLLASAIPLSFAGWGPREGAAAWVFGAAGLGVAAGVEVAVVYGVLSLVATLPGAFLLRSGRVPGRAPQPTRGGPAWVSGPTSS
jgi:uncharacterized membrane protein YbhN (UPF0104 family)